LTTTYGTASFLVTIDQGVDRDVVLSDFQMVPEPGTLGIVGLGGVLRRRRE
jgi:PEP-CTERM motif